ncbi:fatty acid desaturase family protein [Rhabdothermincola salaria]|uniref:fatty acid desaturase family protein n=1 Tax=Rhabdothermincola salaria TaxID=2903142 RepID=UPI001E64C1F1|nr:acyl-CoA desaturase [Rhabdothermincola salaria]MCD9625243.1 acyl-CoA desaturase [Rhabdothermincola salaria]
MSSATENPTVENPTAENPTAENPTAENPTAENPTAENPTALGRPRLSLVSAVRPGDADIRRGRRRLHAKAVGIAALVIVAYWGLVFSSTGWLGRIGFTGLLVVCVVAVGTGILHDANHGAFSASRRTNRLVAYSADVLGASSWVWRFKHNTLHHAHTNVVGRDSDIEQSPFARLAPQQAWRSWHRYQHVYMWVLYGFLTVKWFFASDVAALLKGGFGTDRFPRPPRRREVAVVAGGKLVHLGWAVFIPLLFHPWWGVALFYLVGSWLVGFSLAMVFQLAHCTDTVEFLDGADAERHESFEMRQLRTTANIECRAPLLGGFVRWIMGGLDHQIEHHLSPRLPHTLYPAMATRLRATCAEQALPYHVHRSVWAALRSHGRWLKLLGQDPSKLVVEAEITSDGATTVRTGPSLGAVAVSYQSVHGRVGP